MKRLIAIAVALAAIVICSEGTAQAQSQLHPGGFPYPAYIQQGFQGGPGAFGGFGFQTPREQPPYFAKFPPVYYSHAVKRPYGVSPYAAPAGIVPVEMTLPKPVSKPIVINNPYYKGGDSMNAEIKADVNGADSVDTEMKADAKVKTEVEAEKNKVTGWQANPFFKPQLALN